MAVLVAQRVALASYGVVDRYVLCGLYASQWSVGIRRHQMVKFLG